MINVFNSNYEEIGSLDKNLALHTLGKVKIRYGRKYIDLLNDKGELNVSIPKILQEKDSLEDITKDGFYLVDGNLYAYYKGNIYQLTGVEGDYISFAVEQNLTQEQIDTAQNNIGLEFENITKAKQTIHNGIVFIDDRIFYINGDDVKELTLREPLSSINNQNMGLPPSDNVAIVYKNGHWEYISILTKDDLRDLLPSEEKEDEEDNESIDMFDPIQYSKVYTIKTAQILNSNDNSISYLDNLETIPIMSQQQNDIAILSIPAERVVNTKSISYDGKQTLLLGVESEQTTVSQEDSSVRYNIKQKYDILTFNLIYKDNKFQFCDKNGQSTPLTLGKGFIIPQQLINQNIHPEDLEVAVYIKISNNYWVIKNLALEKRHIYIKAEEPNHQKFKIDYKNAQIALEENTPGNSLSILPHTVLGDLDDVDKYYKDPAVSFRTYTDKESKQGLYSDQPVFSGGEFRGTWPEEQDEESVENFPRYSEKLNEDLCSNHPGDTIDVDDPDDVWRQVIPTIEWIKRNGAMLNRPLRDINEENRTYLPETPTTTTISNITPVSYQDSDSPPIAIVYKNGHWTYDYVVPMSWFLDCCNGTSQITVATPVISGTNPFTNSTNVTITCATEGATIYYTTDGTNPDNTDTPYTGAISINADTTIKAIAYKDGENSEIASQTFTKSIVKVTPIISYVQNQNGTDVEVLNLSNLNSYTSTFSSNALNLEFTITDINGYTPLTRNDFSFSLNPSSNSGFTLLTGSSNKGNIQFPSTNDSYSVDVLVTFAGTNEYNSLTKTWSVIINKNQSLPDYYLRFYMYPDADYSVINVNELIKDTNDNIVYVGVRQGQTMNDSNLRTITLSTYQNYSGEVYDGRIKNIILPNSGVYSNEYGDYLGYPVVLWGTNQHLDWPYPESNPLESVEFNSWIYGRGTERQYNFYTGDVRTNKIDLSTFTDWQSLQDRMYSDIYNDNSLTLNLYAIWKPIKYTITWDLNGGNLVSEDRTYINAFQWNVNPYVIETQNGNTVVKEIYGIKNTYPRWKFNNPIREGYVFLGWTPDYSSTKLTSNVTLTTVWGELKIDSSDSVIPQEGKTITVSYWIDGYTEQSHYTSNIYLSGLYKNMNAPTKVGNPTFNTTTKKWTQQINFSQKTDNNTGIVTIIANYGNLKSNSLELTQGGEIKNLGDFDYMLFTFNFSNDLDLDNVTRTSGTNKSTTISYTEYNLDDQYGGFLNALEAPNRSNNVYTVKLSETAINGTQQGTELQQFIYQYMIYSGDNMFSGGEETCINWNNIISNFSPTEGQKYICIYIICKWYKKSSGATPTLQDTFTFNYSTYKIKSGYRDSSTYFYKPTEQFYFYPSDLNTYTLENRETYFTNNNGRIQRTNNDNYSNCTMNQNADITSQTYIDTNGLEKATNFTIRHNILTGRTDLIRGFFKIPTSSEASGSFNWNT